MYILKVYSRVLIGTLLVLFLDSCVTHEICPYLNKTHLSSGNSFVYYADKYDRLCFQKKFQDGRQFCNGLAAVRINEKWGYINSLGSTVIPFQYDWVSSFGEFGFDENIAVVKNNIDKNKIPMFTACPSWLINKRGEKITPKYGIIFPIEKKLSIVNDGVNFESIGKNFAISDGKWGVINKKGKEIIPCEYDLIYPFRDVITFVQKNGKWGVVNEKGKLIIPCIYDKCVYKSDALTVDTMFDMGNADSLEKTHISNLQNNIIYMFIKDKMFFFSIKGKDI